MDWKWWENIGRGPNYIMTIMFSKSNKKLNLNFIWLWKRNCRTVLSNIYARRKKVLKKWIVVCSSCFPKPNISNNRNMRTHLFPVVCVYSEMELKAKLKKNFIEKETENRFPSIKHLHNASSRFSFRRLFTFNSVRPANICLLEN